MIDKKILNSSQKKAIQYDKGPLLIVAGAGTGKTTVLLERIKYLIGQKKVKPDSILTLTFTNKAASEMLERLDLIMPLGYEEPWISTFHSFCDRVLKEEGLEIGLSPNFKILTPAEAYILFKKHLFEFGLSYFLPLGNPNKFIQAMLKFFSRAQDEDVEPSEFIKWAALQKEQSKNKEDLDWQRWQELAQAYKIWQQIKQSENVLDFGDLITKCIDLLIKRPNLLKKYQKKFKHVLVDEFQDTNFAQLKLIKLLAEPKTKPNLVVVGDDFQAIYKWRGAAVSNIMDFTKHYSSAKTIILNKNYRSTQPLLDKTYHFIKHNEPETLEVKLKIDKKLKAQKKELIKPEVIFLENLEEEADFVADKILNLVAQKNYTFKDFAILARANNHLDPFVAVLKRRGMPYQLVGNRGLFDQTDIRDLVIFSKALINPNDSVNFFQLLHVPIFKIPAALILDLLSQSRSLRQDLWDYIDEKIKDKELDEKNRKKLVYLKEIINKYRNEILDKTSSQLLYEFLWESEFVKKLVKDENLENQLALKNLNLFFKQIKKFEANNNDKGLVAFVDYLDVLMEAGENPAQAEIEDIDTVSLVTVHSAKGLEWPAVFVVNLVKDRFPVRKRRDAIEFPDDLAGEELPKGDSHLLEERRLFYVACTRAQNELFITLAKDCGGKTEKKPSIFIKELSIDLKEIKSEIKSLDWLQKPSLVKAPVVINGRLQLRYLSYSQIDVYQSCPLKYKYRYVLNVPSKPHHALSFGISVHETLQHFHSLELKNQKPNLEDLLFFYKQDFKPEGYESKKHKNERYKKGEQALKNYYKNYKNIFKGKPIKLEHKFRINMGDIPLIGKIDRIDRLENGSYELIDYKTGQLKDQKVVDKDAQLTIYAMAAKWSLGFDVKDLSLFFIEGCKKIKSTRTEAQLKKKYEQVKVVIKEIKGSEFRAKPGYLCKYCEYNLICPFAKKV